MESYCSAQVCPKTTLSSSSSSSIVVFCGFVQRVLKESWSNERAADVSLAFGVADRGTSQRGEIRHERRVEWPNKERAEGILGCNTKQCTPPVLNVLMM